MPLALAEGQAQQAHEDRQVVVAAWLHHQCLLHEHFQQFFEAGLLFRLGLATLQLTFEAGAERPEEAREHCLDQGLLGAEVIVDRRQVDPGLAGNQPQRGFCEPPFREQLLGSIENAFNGFRLGHDYSARQTNRCLKHTFQAYGCQGSVTVRSPLESPELQAASRKRCARCFFLSRGACSSSSTVYNPSHCIKRQSARHVETDAPPSRNPGLHQTLP
ncbi:hypothetical protein D3C73_1190890 [compost metagenome]